MSANDYLQEVMEQKEVVERDLRQKRRAPRKQMAQMAAPAVRMEANFDDEEEEQQALPGNVTSGASPARRSPKLSVIEDEAPVVDTRITGWWRWKTLVVPPNAYVVHTRRGHSKPVNLGLGMSVRFDPRRDSFMVVPATMQTIIVNASCICAELQGVMVQAYVQWIIADFETAYRRLDFSDPVDPMRIVNIQLREQAEATIKDTVATMSIDAVLSDKQPIIKELMRRLREVVEGDGNDGDAGLGLRIVNIQIKEAIVSSATLWESLQRPFRAERQKVARLAELEQHELIRQREGEARLQSEVAEIETREKIEKQRAATEAEEFNREQSEVERRATVRHDADATSFDREQNEKARRARLEAELMETAAEHEKARIAASGELDKQRLEIELAERTRREKADHEESLREIELETARRKLENDVSDGRLREQLLERLPEIASALPGPTEQRNVVISTDGSNAGGAAGSSLHGLLTTILGVVETIRAGSAPKANDTPKG